MPFFHLLRDVFVHLGCRKDDTLVTDLSDDNLHDLIIRKSLLRNDGNCTFVFMIKWLTKVDIGVFQTRSRK